MGLSRRTLVVPSSIALAAAITTTLLWSGIVAVAAPVFDSATISVKRVDETRLAEDPVESAKFTPIAGTVTDSNPKLKEAMAGADENFEILSGAVGYSVPVDDVYKVGISESELDSLKSLLPAGSTKQLANDEKYVSTYDSLNLQQNGKYYVVTIITVGTQ
jgi:hypothetical protein